MGWACGVYGWGVGVCRVLVGVMLEVHKPTDALFIKLDKFLKFTLKITLTYFYMFRSTTIIKEPSLEPN